VLKAVIASALTFVSTSVSALGDQWYLGIGGGASLLQPNPVDRTIDVEEEQGEVVTFFFGRDFDRRSSGQFQLYSLGEAQFDSGNTDTAVYHAGDASVLFRFFDSRDNAKAGRVFGASMYGRFGLGIIERDSDVSLDNDTQVYFGAGAGIETYLSKNLAVRLESLYHENDVGSATLSLVGRFGGRKITPPIAPPKTQFPQTQQAPADEQAEARLDAIGKPQTDTQAVPATLPEPGNTTAVSDLDNDGLPDDADQCQQSTRGFPVDVAGCPVFNGTLQSVQFFIDSAELTATNNADLNNLARLLKQYPQSRYKLYAHTDNSGTTAEQANRTRARLGTIVRYLLNQGLSKDQLRNQLELHSSGGSSPEYSNSTLQGRQQNNRVEVVEQEKP